LASLLRTLRRPPGPPPFPYTTLFRSLSLPLGAPAAGTSVSTPVWRSQPCCLYKAELLESAMSDITLTTLNKLNQSGEKFACLTAYDATFPPLALTPAAEVLLLVAALAV